MNATTTPPAVRSMRLLASPNRVQLSRKKGWKLPPNTVVVSRPSKWGNPFKVTPERSQFFAVGAFQTWLTVGGVTAGIADRKQWMLDNLKTLRGKNLACWCKPGTACHADVLLRLANDRSAGDPRQQTTECHTIDTPSKTEIDHGQVDDRPDEACSALPLPRALYSCKHCADEYSWPPDDLNWSERVEGWVCENCWDDDDHGERGIRLDKEIARQNPQSPANRHDSEGQADV